MSFNGKNAKLTQKCALTYRTLVFFYSNWLYEIDAVLSKNTVV